MKTTIRTIFLLLLTVLWGVGFAQKPEDDPKYGDTPEARQKTLSSISLYVEYVKQDNYKDALPHWRYVYQNYPKASKGTFTSGEKIIKDVLEANTKNAAVFQAYFDTLMMVYDARIEHFGEKGNVRGRQGVAILKYNKSKFEQAYQYLKESVQLEGEETSAATASTFVQTSAAMFKSGKHGADQVVEDFGMAMDVLEPGLEIVRKEAAKAVGTKNEEKLKTRRENMRKAIKNVEVLFVESGAAGCKELIGYFTPKFQEKPDDLKLLKKITKYLDDQGCDDSELFAKSAEQLYKLEPSASAAYSLAKMFMKKEQLDKSIQYYDEAIEQDAKSEVPNEEFQAKCQYQKGLALFVDKKYSASRQAAQQAAKLIPDWGKPYILIARLYASSAGQCSERIDASAVYWVAVDKLQKAKSVDASVADEAQKLIDQYAKHYPNQEEAFFHGISKGTAYTVGCWINESTTARF